MGKGEEALVACGDRSMGIGITIRDMDTGEDLLRIPVCASPPRGLVCLRNQFLVASQINKHGSVGGGAIGIWPLNKPQRPLWNHTLEAIGPLSCTKDGIYLVGGALSGKAYIWDVTSGKLLKTWMAHNKSLNCMVFSDDDSVLISGSDDGHISSITGLLTTFGNYFSLLVSGSLDGTCKVWDFISGRLMQTQVYSLGITSIALNQGDGLLFCGAVNGTIIVNNLAIGLEEDPSIITAGQPLELKGHNGAITALTSSQAGLISASEDCTICIWDVISWEIIRRFNLQKGKVTNLVVVPRSSVLSTSNHGRVSNQYTVSLLEKYPQQINSSTLVSLHSPYKEKETSIEFRSADLFRQQVSDVQKAHMLMALDMQMKLETVIEERVKATDMAKHVMEINRHLQSQLLDLIRHRLFQPTRINIQKAPQRKLKIQSPIQEKEKP